MEFRAGIIAAGHGERFQRAGVTTPKPLLLVAGRTLLERAVDNAVTAGASRVAMIVNAERPEVAAYVRSHRWALPIDLVVRTTPSSMESLFALQPGLGSSPFLLLTVDGIFPDGAVACVVREGLATGSDGALGVTRFVHDENPLRVAVDRGVDRGNDRGDGRVDDCGNGRITAIGPDARESEWITSGVYFFSPAIFGDVAAARHRGLGRLREFLQLLVERGLRFTAVETGKAIDVDDLEDLALAEDALRAAES